MNNREHKSSSSGNRDRCIPRRFIAYNGTVARHEQAKRANSTALATLEEVQVHLEPFITGTQRLGVRGLHLGSGSAMKLCSTRLGYLWLEGAGSGPQQALGEPPDKTGSIPSWLISKASGRP
jgi:hypothetical protein